MFSRARSLKYNRTTGQYSGLTPNNQFGQFCVNCGKNNHTFTQCNEPFSSYGVICFQKSLVDNLHRVMMVCRRHSVYYVEFLRGKYDVNNLEYLITLFSRMTKDEIQLICTSANFEALRNDLGLDNTRRRVFRAEYETSELKFNYILNLGILANVIQCINYIFDESFQIASTPSSPESPGSTFKLTQTGPTSTIGNLCEFIQENRDVLNELKAEMTKQNTAIYKMPEWEVPKGKRQNKETDLQCAIREFCEETGLGPENIRIFKNVVPLEEVYTGVNGVEYKHIYFIGEIVDIPDNLLVNADGSVTSGGASQVSELRVDGQSKEQMSEVSKIMLMDLAGINRELRVFHVSKRNIIQKAFYIIGTLYNFFYY